MIRHRFPALSPSADSATSSLWRRIASAPHLGRSLLAFALFLLLSAITTGIWFEPAVVFKATIESESQFTAQLLYSEDRPGFFSPDHLINVMVHKGKSRLVVPIPAKKVVGLRIDFGWDRGRVRLSNPRLSGRSTAWLNADGFVFSKDVVEHSAEAPDTIGVAFKKGDPYAVYKPKLDVAQSRRFEALFNRLPLVVLYFLFLFLVSRFLVGLAADSIAGLRANWRRDCDWAQSGHWIAAFDVVRVLAFLFVAFSHVIWRANAYALPLSLHPRLLPWGGLGVSFFIVLSGASLSVGSFRKDESWASFYLRRLRTILPPFWVAYFVCLMLQFGVFGTMAIKDNPLSLMPTLFGIDGYLSLMVPTYALVGEWYLGFILLLYMLAPAVHRLVERAPLASLAAFFVVSVLAAKATPILRDFIPLWNKIPRFNVIPHVFEFAFGMFFVGMLRPRFRRYSFFALVCGVAVMADLALSNGPWFDFTPVGILVSVAAFGALCFLFDSIVLGNVAAEVFASLGKTSFLAFLYHHRVICWLVSPGKQMDNLQLAYQFLLIVSISYALAYASLKPADILARLVFGEKKKRVQ